MRPLIVLLLLLTTSLPAFGQFAAHGRFSSSANVQEILSGVDGYSKLGPYLLIPPDSQPKREKVGVVHVDAADTAQIVIKFSDAKRQPVADAVEIEPRTWLVRAHGKVWVDITAVDFSLQTFNVEAVVIDLGDKIEPDPIDPDPIDPDPIDPDDPDEGDSPFPGDGLRVLMVYDMESMAKYPLDQKNTLYGTAIRKWANANCAKDASGTAEMRVLDQDSVSDVGGMWKDALALPRESLPWIVIGNGKTGYQGPLPKNEADTIALMEKYK